MTSSSEPLRVRKIDNAQAIKALADPLRLRVLTLLMRDHQRTWTVKEIASELDQSTTKLYHHINLLEQAELIRDVETRLVSGIVEHRYASGQRGLEFDDALYRSPETRDASLANVAYMMDEARDDLLTYLGDEGADLEQVTISKLRMHLTQDEIDELTAAMNDLVERYRNLRDEHRKALPTTEVLFFMHPSPND